MSGKPCKFTKPELRPVGGFCSVNSIYQYRIIYLHYFESCAALHPCIHPVTSERKGKMVLVPRESKRPRIIVFQGISHLFSTLESHVNYSWKLIS